MSHGIIVLKATVKIVIVLMFAICLSKLAS